MKINKFLTYTVASALTLAAGSMMTGCTDNFEELNTNKYEVDPDNLPFESQFVEPITYVYAPQQNMFQFWTNLSTDLFSGYFMTPHNFGGNGNVDYKLNRGFCGGMYENFNLHIFNNTRRLIKTCDEKGLVDYAAIMRVVQVYALSTMTDTYGPVAYQSVLDGNDVSFYYDSQESIYNAMFALLDEAITGFKNGTSDVANMQQFDYWCQGNRELWVKVANQFKLRLAMRIVKANPGLAKQKAEEAVSGGVLTSADKDILIDQGLSNELTRMFEWGDCGMNANLVTILEGYNDPRIALYITKNTNDIKVGDNVVVAKDSKYLGIRGGCNLPNKPNQWGNFSNIVCTYSTPMPVMKAAESYFLRAEGALRGWNMGGNAKDLYEEGIRLSIKNELKYKSPYSDVKSISDEEIDAYINGTTLPADFVDPVDAQNSIKAMNTVPVKWDEGASNEQKLQRIITQKWIANFPLSTEAWAEYRRTGYPKLFPNRVNSSDGTIDTDEQIRRLIYSEVEINTNNDELQKGIQVLNQENSSSKFTGDIGGTRVWWDKANVGNF
ncbi:SusD/RagB family nutrient-binding outer membrane lipoprotein [Parabacteroides timonensis]|uniref:SusD/RagB family nutrient-binding outer membrane lipoprotein n=1 Tax=Parabacteroides timonensis TaxID=1871013 RepID=UPI00094E5BFE|nr:SusD/RagB family nutrient-binding outer membrane lipoprotein [Parabacteroides timonensis]